MINKRRVYKVLLRARGRGYLFYVWGGLSFFKKGEKDREKYDQRTNANIPPA